MHNKNEIINKIKLHENDTGSVDIQIATLSHHIHLLTGHLNTHKKDLHAKRGLISKVNRRKRLLKYLKRKKNEKYISIIKDLNIRK